MYHFLAAYKDFELTALRHRFGAAYTWYFFDVLAHCDLSLTNLLSGGVLGPNLLAPKFSWLLHLPNFAATLYIS